VNKLIYNTSRCLSLSKAKAGRQSNTALASTSSAAASCGAESYKEFNLRCKYVYKQANFLSFFFFFVPLLLCAFALTSSPKSIYDILHGK
jgi:hypothetical protein